MTEAFIFIACGAIGALPVALAGVCLLVDEMTPTVAASWRPSHGSLIPRRRQNFLPNSPGASLALSAGAKASAEPSENNAACAAQKAEHKSEDHDRISTGHL